MDLEGCFLGHVFFCVDLRSVRGVVLLVGVFVFLGGGGWFLPLGWWWNGCVVVRGWLVLVFSRV